MTILSDETIKRRTIRVKLDWNDLQKILRDTACRDAGVPEHTVDWSIAISQVTEGSPSYPVKKWEAIATLTLPVD